MAKPRTVRDLQLAAMAGDRAACRALLIREGRRDLAKEVRADRQSRRVRRVVAALCAGVGTDWENYNAKTGEYENDLASEVSMWRGQCR